MKKALAAIFDFLDAITKIFLVIIFILFLPWLFLWNTSIEKHTETLKRQPHVFKLGIECVSHGFLNDLFPQTTKKYSVGLVTNHTGVDQHNKRTIDILHSMEINIHSIFSPYKENDTIDQTTGIPIISLYGQNGINKLNKKNIEPIDLFIYDLQDIGIRHYGYTVTLLEVMYSAARYNKPIVILDRPNLLGACMEGAFTTISPTPTNTIKSIPLRHGMTIGELAYYFNEHILTKKANLHVVPMKSYQRTYSQTDLAISHLSPNLSSLNSCYGYSFLGLLGEISPFDIGIGTDKAFQCITLPNSLNFSQKKWKELGKILKYFGIESAPYRYWSKRKKQDYSGLRFFIRNINDFSACKTLLAIITFFKKYDIAFSFSQSFDTVIGNTTLRDLMINVGNETVIEEINTNIEQFFNNARTAFIYKPYPQLIKL